MNISIIISNKVFYTFLLFCALTIISSVVVAVSYAQPGPDPGHKATEVWIQLADGREMTLQDAISNEEFGGQEVVQETRVIMGTSQISGLTPGKRYLVSVYGHAEDSAGISIMTCGNSPSLLATTGSFGHTGRAGSESAVLEITAPSNGCISGFTRGTRNHPANNMVAWSIN